MSNDTSTIVSCSALPPQWATDYTNIMLSFQFGRIQAFFSIILLLCFPFEVASVLMTALGFIMLRNFHNHSKIYYYSIAISNLIGLMFQDIAFGIVSLNGVVYGNLSDLFTFILIPLYIRPLENLSIVTCSLLYYFRDIGPVWEIWTTCMFGIHRMLIVVFPFKSHTFLKIFNKWTLGLILIIAGIIYIPDFFIARMNFGQFCFFNTISLGPFSFLKIYYGQLFYLTIIFPILIICITIGVIITQIAKSAKMRSQFNRINSHANRKNDFKEHRATLISISIGIIYIIFMIPVGIINILISLLNTCDHFGFVLYNILYSLNSVIQYNSLIVRMGDGLVFFLMITEFRQSILNSLRCHIPTYAAVR